MNYKHIALFLFAVPALCQSGSQECSKDLVNMFPDRDIISIRTENAITLDGKLDEAAWASAPVIDGFYTWNEDRIIPAHSRTQVRVLWDDHALYIGAEMEDLDIWAEQTGENARTWDDDVFEIFIRPDEDSSHYYEFHVTPLNTVLQIFYPRRRFRKYDSLIYTGGLQSAVTVRGELNNWRKKDHGWTVEIAIPFSAFSETCLPPRPGSVWRVAFCRYDYSYYLPKECSDGQELSSSAKLSMQTFHRYEDYDRLVFR